MKQVVAKQPVVEKSKPKQSGGLSMLVPFLCPSIW